MSLLVQLLNHTHASEYLQAQSVSTRHIYKPTDAEERQAIMDGDIPEPLDLLLHMIRTQKDLNSDNLHWIKDPTGPYIILNIIEYLT